MPWKPRDDSLVLVRYLGVFFVIIDMTENLNGQQFDKYPVSFMSISPNL